MSCQTYCNLPIELILSIISIPAVNMHDLLRLRGTCRNLKNIVEVQLTKVCKSKLAKLPAFPRLWPVMGLLQAKQWTAEMGSYRVLNASSKEFSKVFKELYCIAFRNTTMDYDDVKNPFTDATFRKWVVIFIAEPEKHRFRACPDLKSFEEIRIYVGFLLDRRLGVPFTGEHQIMLLTLFVLLHGYKESWEKQAKLYDRQLATRCLKVCEKHHTDNK